jgi:hypothetical protein
VPREFLIPQRATAQDSYQLAKLCEQVEREDGPVLLDCRKTAMLGPLGVALLASTVALRRSAGRLTELLAPEEDFACQFFDEVGLARFAKGTATGIGTLEVRQLLALDATYTGDVTQMVLRGVPGMNDDTSYPIQLCLNELLQNVFEWSKSPIGCTVLARWFHRTRSVQLAVVDRGIGIPAALRRKKVRGLHRSNDADVVVAAVTEPRLTSRANKVGGLGLKTIREIVCTRKGRLTIVSLGAKVVWNAEKLGKYPSYPLRGTAIEIDFRPMAPVPHPDEYVAVF